MAKEIPRYFGDPQIDQVPVGAVPSASAMAAPADAERSFITGLGRLMGAADNFAQTFMDKIVERQTRDADIEMTKLFRGREMEIRKTKLGAQTDGLLNAEEEWSNKTAGELREKMKVPGYIFDKLWHKHTSSYLNEIGTYQIQQQTIADKQSRAAYVDTLKDGLIRTPLGDVDALTSYFEQVRKTYPNDNIAAEKAIDDGILVAVQSWARDNPSATIAWFRQNKKDLETVVGRQTIKIDTIIQQAENRIHAEASYRNSLESVAWTREQRAQKRADNAAFNDFITDAISGEMDDAKFYDYMGNQAVSGETRKNMYSFFKGMAKDDMSKINKAVYGDLMVAVYENQADDQWVARAQKAVAAGQITGTEYKTLLNARDTIASKMDTSIKPMLTDASKYIKNFISPSNGLMGKTNPDAENKYLKVNQALYREAQGKTPEQVAKLVDFNDPGSFINKLIDANTSDKPNFRDAMSVPKTNWVPTIPEKGTPVISPDKVKRPGETFSEWKKRTQGK